MHNLASLATRNGLLSEKENEWGEIMVSYYGFCFPFQELMLWALTEMSVYS